MANYKKHFYKRGKFLSIHFDRQILPSTFEYTLSYLVVNEIGLTIF